MEVEIIVASKGGKESAWIRALIKDLGERETTPIFILTLILLTLFCDNQGAVDLIKSTKFYNKAKYIEIRYFYIRNDLVQKGLLKVVYITGKD